MGKLKARRLTLGVLGIVMSLLMLVSGGLLSPGSASADSAVTVCLDPSSGTAAFNNTFTVDVKVTITGSENVDTVQTLLNFDPTKLEVLNITRGAAISAWDTFSAFNYWDNTNGTISYFAYTYDNTLVMNQTFVVATIEFKALEVIENAPITFVTDGSLKTNLWYKGVSLLPVVQNGEVTVKTFTLMGYVDLQRRTTAEGWVTNLTVTFIQPGTGKEVAIREVTTDNTGNFTVSDAPVGTYDIRVKCSHTLANRKNGVVISEETTGPINFGTLLEGDANGDNVVDGGDVSLLGTSFFKSKGEAGFLDNCDYNRDGVVDGGDVSLMGTNFFKYGDIII